MTDEDKKYDISRVGTIIEVVALIEVKEDNFFGCGAHEYCEEHNLQHTVSQPGEKWFVNLCAESAGWRFRYSLEDELSLFIEERKPHFPYKTQSRPMRFYKNYDDIVRDRRDTERRRRGEHMWTEDFQFVRFMAPRTVTVDGIAETL